MRWRPGQKNFTAIVGGYTELGQQDNDLYYLLCPPCEGQKSLQKGCVVTDKGEQFQVLYLETREVGCEIYFLFAVLKKIYGEESA